MVIMIRLSQDWRDDCVWLYMQVGMCTYGVFNYRYYCFLLPNKIEQIN